MGQNLVVPQIAVKRFKVTGQEQDQLKQTYQVLCQRSGTTKINAPVFHGYFTDYVDQIVSHLFWSIFDTKFDGLLDFEEWATGLALVLRGTKDDRIRLILNMFDEYHRGFVTEKVIRQLFATNLFAARNIIKPFDWERLEAQEQQKKRQETDEFVKALYDYAGTNELELSFKVGDILQVLERVEGDWLWCEFGDTQGYAPATYVEIITAPPKQSKGKSKFQTIKRGTELDVLVSSLLSHNNEALGGIPKDQFLKWALEHEMDRCFDFLEKFDLRPPASISTRSTMASEPTQSVQNSSKVPPSKSQQSTPSPATQQLAAIAVPSLPAREPVLPASGKETAAVPKQIARPQPKPVVNQPISPRQNGAVAPQSQDVASSPQQPVVVAEPTAEELRPETANVISPELATILKAAGIADKELDDMDLTTFVSYFLSKHAPKADSASPNNSTAGRRRNNTVRGNQSEPPKAAVPAPPPVPSTVNDSASNLQRSESTPILDEIRAKKLRKVQRKTNLSTLSKKDLTGLGLLLRTQIDSRRHLMQEEPDSDSNSDFDD